MPHANTMQAARHAFLAAVQEARSARQFRLPPPARIIRTQWAMPVTEFLGTLGTLDEATIRTAAAACAAAPLKIHCLLALLEVG